MYSYIKCCRQTGESIIFAWRRRLKRRNNNKTHPRPARTLDGAGAPAWTPASNHGCWSCWGGVGRRTASLFAVIVSR